MARFANVGIIGLGVIGASLGMALKHCPGNIRVLGRDISKDIVNKAREMGAVDEPLDDAGIFQCDLVVICTPLNYIKNTLVQIKGHLKPGAVVSDVGSVKGWVMKAYQEILPAEVFYIGGHPMAGSEKNGLSAADKFLLENAAYILTPPDAFPVEILAAMTELLTSAGARVMCMNAADHDQAVAKVSHLPHVIAGALMHNFKSSGATLALAGGSLRDMTRIAGSNPAFWGTVFELNRPALLEEIDNFVANILTLRNLIGDGCWNDVVFFLEDSSKVKQSMVPHRKCLEDSADIVAIVPDQPGMIGKIGWILGEHNINIKDIHVLSVRDEDEGSIKLSVPREDGARACEVLTSNGLISWIRD